MRTIFLLLTITSLLLLSSCIQPRYDEFAQCLTKNDVKMFGTDWCSVCKSQKAEFGASFKYVDYVNCDFQTVECKENDVNRYPTWKINGTKYVGKQSFNKLASLSGCELNE